MTPSDFKRWTADPVTQAYFESLRGELKELEEHIVNGRAMGPTTDEIAITYTQWTAERKGRVESLEHVPEWAREETDEAVREPEALG